MARRKLPAHAALARRVASLEERVFSLEKSLDASRRTETRAIGDLKAARLEAEDLRRRNCQLRRHVFSAGTTPEQRTPHDRPLF